MTRGRRPGGMADEAAEAIGARALLFMAEDPGRLARFLAETGLDPGTLRREAHAPAMLAAVLEHLMTDESALLAFAANGGLPPEDVARAAAALGGSSPWDST